MGLNPDCRVELQLLLCAEQSSPSLQEMWALSFLLELNTNLSRKCQKAFEGQALSFFLVLKLS